MAWTSLEIIKKHLQDSGVVIEKVHDEVHVLVGIESVQLNHVYIKSDSEKVKTIDFTIPYADGENILYGTTWKPLDHAQIVPNTVVVASDQLLSIVYEEGVDYVMDYELGEIKRDVEGSIPDGGIVYVWYQYYKLHTKNTDYIIDEEAGSIARIEGGGIGDGSQVWVDYKIDALTVSENLINEGITEAEGKILDRLSSDYNASSTEQGLKTGATELTLSIVARGMAAEAMRMYPSNKAAEVSKQWQTLSIRYEKQAWETLSKFLASSELRSAKVQANVSLG
jgi:hypothetical protein